jgi:hypothetical protein
MPTTHDILTFEEHWGAHTSWKEQAIRDELGLEPARFYQLLNRAIDTTEALESHPMLVRRLQRIRDEQRTRRQQRRSA